MSRYPLGASDIRSNSAAIPYPAGRLLLTRTLESKVSRLNVSRKRKMGRANGHERHHTPSRTGKARRALRPPLDHPRIAGCIAKLLEIVPFPDHFFIAVDL